MKEDTTRQIPENRETATTALENIYIDRDELRLTQLVRS